MDACENGDYPTVTRILESIKDFNIDVTDNLGRSALRLAVENEHLEVHTQSEPLFFMQTWKLDFVFLCEFLLGGTITFGQI